MTTLAGIWEVAGPLFYYTGRLSVVLNLVWITALAWLISPPLVIAAAVLYIYGWQPTLVLVVLAWTLDALLGNKDSHS